MGGQMPGKTQDLETDTTAFFHFQTLIMAAINLPQQPLVALLLSDLSLVTRVTVMRMEKQPFLSFRNMA